MNRERLLGLLVLLSVLSLMGGADPSKPHRFPTDHLRGYGEEPLGFLLRQVDDFRSLLCDREVIAAREGRGECAVDFAFRRARSPSTVHVRDGTTLSNVLSKVTHDWDGGQPQVRLISRNAIVQSPLGTQEGVDAKTREFLQLVVHPGDIVIIGRVE